LALSGTTSKAVALRVKPRTDGLQHQIGTAKGRGGRYRYDRTIRDRGSGLGWADNFGHAAFP